MHQQTNNISNQSEIPTIIIVVVVVVVVVVVINQPANQSNTTQRLCTNMLTV